MLCFVSIRRSVSLRRPARLVAALAVVAVASIGCDGILGIGPLHADALDDSGLDGTLAEGAPDSQAAATQDSTVFDGDTGVQEPPGDVGDAIDAADTAFDSPLDSPDECPPDAAAAAPDGASDAACDPTQSFATPVQIASLGFPARWVRFLPDGRTVYYEWETSLYTATLSADSDAGFGTPMAIIPAVTQTDGAVVTDEAPTVTPDQKTLFFASTRSGHYEIWSATRTLSTDPFGAPQLVTSLHDPNFDSRATFVQGDGSYLYFVSNRAPSPHMEVYRAPLVGGLPVGTVERLPEFMGLDAYAITLAPDGLTAYLSMGDSASGLFQVFSTKRACSSLPFEAPNLVRELYSAIGNSDVTWITLDQCTLYFSSFRAGDGNSWMYFATRP
jgi:hypothetical protein